MQEFFSETVFFRDPFWGSFCFIEEGKKVKKISQEKL
jgi:hypothetical protein